MAEEKLEKIERLPAQVTAQMLEKEQGLFLNVARFEHAQRVATMLAGSTMVPDHFKGNTGNCLIALNLAERMRLDVFMLMQSVYVVHGRPGIEGKLVIALIEGHGRFGPLHFKFEGSGLTGAKVRRPNSCRAYAVDLKTKETIEGPEVTWEMVTSEGWNKPKQYRDGSGQMPSKWETMPELMFSYRAASFFGRVHDPGALMGFRSMEEIEDMEEVNITPTSPANREEEKAKERKEAIEKFKASKPQIVGEISLDEFLKITAEANRCTPEDVMVQASADLENFWAAYDKWVAKKKPKAKEEAKPEEGSGKNVQPLAGTAPNPPPAERQTAPPLPSKPEKEWGPIWKDKKVKPMERVRDLWQQNDKLYYAAMQAAEVEVCNTDAAATIILNKALEMEAKFKK